MIVKEEDLSNLIASVYDVALNPTDWPRLAQQFARAFATESCAIFQLNLAEGSAGILGITNNFDAKAITDYETYYHQKDLVAIRMARSGADRAMLSTDVVKEAEFLNSEIFVDFARPMRLGFFWAVGGTVEVEQRVRGAIGIHRTRDAGAFQEEDKRRLAMLLPHLSRAMLLGRRLRGLTQNNRIVLDAVEKLAVGMIAVDAQSTLLFANPTAERLLHAGLGLMCRQGRLGVTDPTKDGELRRLIQKAGLAAFGRSSEAGGVLVLPRAVGRPLSLLVCPLAPHALTTGLPVAAALLIFGDPDASPSTSTQALMGFYGLTHAEARLMAALVDGESLEDYADRRQISINTARTQSKQIFAKTGQGRQADLIREVLTNPALRVRVNPGP
jgi:DNA-binding CsgD family transcriptional regulator/PAS domain-containing protein